MRTHQSIGITRLILGDVRLTIRLLPDRTADAVKLRTNDALLLKIMSPVSNYSPTPNKDLRDERILSRAGVLFHTLNSNALTSTIWNLKSTSG